MLAYSFSTLLTWIYQLPSSLLAWIPQLADALLPWINQYGAFALFFLLALGIIALPIPDETLLVTAGSLIATGNLSLIPTVLAAIGGAWCGITVSYWIGAYLGTYIIETRLGKLLGLKKKFKKAQYWFNRIGKWSLVIGYFIPGVRHFVGYIAGSLSFPYQHFGLFAYTGGALWATIFLTIGYIGHDAFGQILQKLWSILTHFS